MIQDLQTISDLCHHFFEHPSSRGQPSSVNDITTTAIDTAAYSCDNNYEKGVTVERVAVMANCEFQTGGYINGPSTEMFRNKSICHLLLTISSIKIQK